MFKIKLLQFLLNKKKKKKKTGINTDNIGKDKKNDKRLINESF